MTRGWVTSGIASCSCGWGYEGYGEAVKKAREHHRKTGHFCSVECARVVQFGDKKP